MGNFLSDLYHKYISGRTEETFTNNLPKTVPDTSKGVTQEDIDQGTYTNGFSNTYVNFNVVFEGKRQRIAFYRDMSNFSEISDSLDYICDESVVQNLDGDFLEIEFDSLVPKNVQKRIKRQLEYLSTEVFHTEDKLWELYRKWLVDGEIYLEVVLNPNQKSIQTVKLLPSYTMTPKYEGDKITEFNQYIVNADALKNGASYAVSDDADRKFKPNQILYSNYGKYGRNNLDPLGYLDASIKPYNQLKSMEDSLVVYRLTRATERRVFNVATGRMAKGKAEEYIKRLISKHKSKMGYDSATGALQTTHNIMSLTEDFWFGKDETGKGTEVSTLAGGMNIGEIKDVEYFLTKLYKTLKLPPSRWQSTPQYTSSTEIGRDEIKFTNFVKRLQTKFKKIFTESLLLQMKLQGFESRWIDESLFTIKMIPATYVQKDKELEMRKKQIEAMRDIAEYMIAEGNDKGYFAPEFALKKFVGLTDEDMILNDRLKEKYETDKKIENDNVKTAKGGEEEPVNPETDTVTDIDPETGKVKKAPENNKENAPEEKPEETPEEPVKEESVNHKAKKSVKDKLANLERYNRNFKILNGVQDYMLKDNNENLNTSEVLNG